MDANGIISIVTMVVMAAIATGAIVWRSGDTGGRLRQKVKNLCTDLRKLVKRVDKNENDHREDLTRIFDQIKDVGIEVRAIRTEVNLTVETSHGRLRRSIVHHSKALAVVLGNCSHCDPDLVNKLLRGPGFLLPDDDNED